MGTIWLYGRVRLIKSIMIVVGLFLLLSIVLFLKTNRSETFSTIARLQEKTVESEKPSYFFIILITTDPTKSAKRNVIRETWLSQSHPEVKHLFLVSIKGLIDEVQQDIKNENSQHQDMLILNDVVESYATLTEKVLTGMQFIYSTYHFNFMLKCDDDSFVRVPLLLKELHKQPQKLVYWGFFKGGSSVFQKGKWKESDWFLCDTYLPYALGGGYILSSDLVQFIANSAPLLQQYKSEDVSVGVWLSPLKLHRIHDVRFDTEFKSRGCYNEYLITHKQSASEMRAKYSSLVKTGTMCTSQMRTRYSYNYNWTVPPSKCCKNFDPDLP